MEEVSDRSEQVKGEEANVWSKETHPKSQSQYN